MNFKIFEPFYVYIDGKLTFFLGDRLSAVLAQVSGPLRAALILYIVLYGIAVVRGAIAEPMADFAIRGMKLCFIFALATSAAYTDFVANALFHVLPDTLTRALSGADVPNIGASFDQFFNRAAYLGERIGRMATPLQVGPIVEQACVVVVGALAAALGFGIVTLAKVALALLVALGPIFVACSLFEATRRFFFGWLSQCVNYLILFALIVSMFQVVLAFVSSQWSNINGPDAISGGFIFIAVCLLGAIFFLQVPSIAAGIAGGASTGLADFFAAAALSRHGARGETNQSRAPQTKASANSMRPSGAQA